MPFLDFGNLRVHYELSGRESGDVVLLSNSLGSSLRMWDKVLPVLESDYRVLRYDTRGHGGSSVPPGPYAIDCLGGDVVRMLDEFGMDQVNFCGLSLGGIIGLWLGVHAPHRVGRMALANTAARIGSQDIWDERIAIVRRSGMEALAAAMPARWFTSEYRNAHRQEMTQIQQMIASTDPDGYCGCCAALREADLRATVGSVRMPCLVIAGKRDPATTPADGRALASALAQSTYVELDSSHLSAWERANEFGIAVRTFFEKGGRHG